MTDALGFFYFSNVYTPDQMGLSLSTGTTGDIDAYTFELEGYPGTQAGVVEPTFIGDLGLPIADYLVINNNTNTEWNVATSTPGQWTQTLNGFQGGTASTPVYLISGPSVASVNGFISGIGAMDYYSFLWNGGPFSATASVTGANRSGSYLFSEGLSGTCSSGGTSALNSGDNFTGTIAFANLLAGTYCIGIDANSSLDPSFTLTFNTPVEGMATPEPTRSLTA